MNAERPSGTHRVLADVADLAQLQLQLLAVDGRVAGRRGIGAVIYLAIAASLLISTATVGLLGFGWMLHETAGWPVGWSLLAMAFVALLLTAAVLGLAYLSIKKAAAAMQEMGAEFAENLEWVRAAMGAPGPSPNPYPGGPNPQAAYPGQSPAGPYPPGAYPPGAYPPGAYPHEGSAGGAGGHPVAPNQAAEHPMRADHSAPVYSRY